MVHVHHSTKLYYYLTPNQSVTQYRAEWIIAFGALVGLTSVLVISLIGQPRILMSMARDGLLPENFFAAIHPTYGTPYKSTMVTGVFVGCIAGFIPLEVLVELVSIGTLFAFFLVCTFIVILRRTQPQRPRPFRVPYAPWLPGLGAVSCFLLMLSLPWGNWIRLLCWLVLGMIIYFGYAKNRARQRRSTISGDVSLADFDAPPSEAYSNAVGSYTPSSPSSNVIGNTRDSSIVPISSGIVPLPMDSVTMGSKVGHHHSDLSFDLSPANAAFTHSLPDTPPALSDSLTHTVAFGPSSDTVPPSPSIGSRDSGSINLPSNEQGLLSSPSLATRHHGHQSSDDTTGTTNDGI